MYSTLMLHLELESDNAALLDIAGDLAERFNAGVTGIVACQPLPTVVGDGFLTGEIIDRDRAAKAAQINALEKAFRTALQHRARGVAWRAQLTYDDPTQYIAEQLRGADLLITRVNSSGSWLDATGNVNTTDLIMQAGRPVLVVPEHTRKLVAENILVGWKDTRETRRAIADALPFLLTAKHVVVVEVVRGDDGISYGRRNTREVCDWLGRHKIPAEPLAVSAGVDAAAAFEDIAMEQAIDLVVAGAYGHSRFREWVLGGVTRELLLHSKRCALLSH
ncbi:MAG: universal stress protein [Rhodanobacteraceae bacterium]|nr:MAG: universal stress protein [Rhodanobacteraceae bacterium]